MCAIEYEKYPDDEQVIQIRVESYGFNSHFVLVNFTNPLTPIGQYKPVFPVTFVTNKDSTESNFQCNPIWNYTYVTTAVQTPNYGTSSILSYFPQPVVYLHITRQSKGIVYRLAVPILLLILLVGVTFWGDPTGRVDTTITILLATSALYIGMNIL